MLILKNILKNILFFCKIIDTAFCIEFVSLIFISFLNLKSKINIYINIFSYIKYNR